MKKLSITLLALLANAICVSGVSATDFTLYDLAKYEDGAVASLGSSTLTPGGTSILTLNFSGSGSHAARAFVNVEIDQVVNTYFNEYGAQSGNANPGLTWEIDEPGYFFGDIWTNFKGVGLDNTNAVPSTAPEDVSMALGWDFSLVSGETAMVKFFLDAVAPTSGFYLSQTDPDSNATVYFYSTLTITPVCTGDNCNPVPEPSTALLFGPALAGLLLFRRKSAKTA